MATGPTLSIIIVNYNTRDLLAACLESILVERDLAYEVIVVDNCSHDGSADVVAERFPSIHLIRSEVNCGFARGNNIGIEQAGGEYILMLNPDTEVSSDTLRVLVQFMRENPDVSATGCKVVYPDGRIQASCGYVPTLWTAFWGGTTVHRLYRWLSPGNKLPHACVMSPGMKCEVETLLGACVILRRDVLDRVGLLDDKMFMYFEENDLFLRIRRAGGKVMFLPDTQIVHHAGGSLNSASIGRAVRHFQESQEYYLKKNFGLKHVYLLRVAIALTAIAKTAVLSLVCPFAGRGSGQRFRDKRRWQWHTFVYYIRLLFRAAPAHDGAEKTKAGESR